MCLSVSWGWSWFQFSSCSDRRRVNPLKSQTAQVALQHPVYIEKLDNLVPIKHSPLLHDGWFMVVNRSPLVERVQILSWKLLVCFEHFNFNSIQAFSLLSRCMYVQHCEDTSQEIEERFYIWKKIDQRRLWRLRVHCTSHLRSTESPSSTNVVGIFTHSHIPSNAQSSN